MESSAQVEVLEEDVAVAFAMDTSRWPICVTDVNELLSERDLTEYLERFEALLRRREPMVMLLHAHTSRGLGRAGVQRIGRWSVEHRELFEGQCVGFGFISPPSSSVTVSAARRL